MSYLMSRIVCLSLQKGQAMSPELCALKSQSFLVQVTLVKWIPEFIYHSKSVNPAKDRKSPTHTQTEVLINHMLHRPLIIILGTLALPRGDGCLPI